MTIHELAELVGRMRHAQKEYFRTKSQAAISEAKRLERKVDQALVEIAQKQRELFVEDDSA